MYELFPYVLLLGFDSVAYTDGSLIVIDMRGPRVILQVGKSQPTAHHHGFLHRNSPGVDPVLNLTWAISGVKSGRFLLFYTRELSLNAVLCRLHASNSASCYPCIGTSSDLYACAG